MVGPTWPGSIGSLLSFGFGPSKVRCHSVVTVSPAFTYANKSCRAHKKIKAFDTLIISFDIFSNLFGPPLQITSGEVTSVIGL
jgi:hypothetical protein